MHPSCQHPQFVAPEQSVQNSSLPIAITVLADQQDSVFSNSLGLSSDIKIETINNGNLNSMNIVNNVTNGSDLIDNAVVNNNNVNSEFVYIYYQNVRGLRTKINNFHLVCSLSEYDVIALTETWLTPAILDSELFTSKFVVHRCDRSVSNSIFGLGGGVLVAVNSKYTSEQINVPYTQHVEIIIVKSNICGQTIYFCCVYIPSGSLVSVYQDYAIVFDKVFSYINAGFNEVIIFLGDFNLPAVNWVVDEDNHTVFLPMNITSESEKCIIDTVLSNGFHQHNHVLNNNNRLLDLVFSNSSEWMSVLQCHNPLSVVDVHHMPIDILLDVSSNDIVRQNILNSRFNFRRSNFSALNLYYKSINWYSLLELDTSVELALDKFYNILMDGISRWV